MLLIERKTPQKTDNESSSSIVRRNSDQSETDKAKAANKIKYTAVHEQRSEEYDGTCLRPLGLCDLGGCCDTCWYRPDHPRFKSE